MRHIGECLTEVLNMLLGCLGYVIFVVIATNADAINNLVLDNSYESQLVEVFDMITYATHTFTR